MRMRLVLWKGPRSLPVGPRSHECYKGKKNIGFMIIKWQFSAAKLAKQANYASSALFGKYLKIMLVMTNYAKNYASQEPVLAQSIKPGRGACSLVPVHHFSPQMCCPSLPQKSLIRRSYKCAAKADPLINILGANRENLGCPYTSATFFPDTTPF